MEKKTPTGLEIDLHRMFPDKIYVPSLLRDKLMEIWDKGLWPSITTPDTVYDQFQEMALGAELVRMLKADMRVILAIDSFTASLDKRTTGQLNNNFGDTGWNMYGVPNTNEKEQPAVEKTPHEVLLNAFLNGPHGKFDILRLHEVLAKDAESGKWPVLAAVVSHTMFTINNRFSQIQALLPQFSVTLKLGYPAEGSADHAPWELLCEDRPHASNTEYQPDRDRFNAFEGGPFGFNPNYRGNVEYPHSQDRWSHLSNDYLIEVLSHYMLTQVAPFPDRVDTATIPQGLELRQLLMIRLGGDRAHRGMPGMFGFNGSGGLSGFHNPAFRERFHETAGGYGQGHAFNRDQPTDIYKQYQMANFTFSCKPTETQKMIKAYLDRMVAHVIGAVGVFDGLPIASLADVISNEIVAKLAKDGVPERFDGSIMFTLGLRDNLPAGLQKVLDQTGRKGGWIVHSPMDDEKFLPDFYFSGDIVKGQVWPTIY